MEHGNLLHALIPLTDFSNFQFAAVLKVDDRKGSGSGNDGEHLEASMPENMKVIKKRRTLSKVGA
jgi:hypothetical protein